jgi:hypothetical protein
MGDNPSNITLTCPKRRIERAEAYNNPKMPKNLSSNVLKRLITETAMLMLRALKGGWPGS